MSSHRKMLVPRISVLGVETGHLHTRATVKYYCRASDVEKLEERIHRDQHKVENAEHVAQFGRQRMQNCLNCIHTVAKPVKGAIIVSCEIKNEPLIDCKSWVLK